MKTIIKTPFCGSVGPKNLTSQDPDSAAPDYKQLD